MGLRGAVEDKKEELEALETQFAKKYQRAMFDLEKASRDDYTGSGYLSPSSIGGDCLRQLFFKWNKAKKDELDWQECREDEWFFKGLDMRDNGTLAHERMQEVLQYMSKFDTIKMLDIEELAEEARIAGKDTEFLYWDDNRYEAKCMNEDLHIRFFADGAINFGGKDYLVEIKTTSLFSWNKLNGSPKDIHIPQAVAYAYALNINDVIFIYEDRNFCQKEFIHYHVTEDEKQELLQKVKQVREYVEEEIVPNAIKTDCKFCDYKDLCSELGEEQRNWKEIKN